MKLSVISLTFNKLDYTKKYIESLYKYTSNFELIIVDNGSTDGTVEYSKALPDVKLILNDKNVGFSKGNNQAIEIAQGEFIAFLNNDILLSPNWFEMCEEVFQNENVGFVSPIELSPRFCNVTENNYLKLFRSQNLIKKSFYGTSFSCVVARRDVLDKIGFFDENYSPAFFEDNDIKMRAIEAGFGVYVTKKSCFFHHGSITSKKLNNNFEKNREYYYKKFPFAEYQMEAQEEIYKYKVATRYLNYFPINIFYKLILLLEKVGRNLLRIRR